MISILIRASGNPAEKLLMTKYLIESLSDDLLNIAFLSQIEIVLLRNIISSIFLSFMIVLSALKTEYFNFLIPSGNRNY